jgi:hypothetical protein
MAMALACLSAAPVSAQYLPDMNFPDAPLSLGQEAVVSDIRQRDRSSFLIAGKGLPKSLSEWTQSDLAIFRKNYDERIRFFGSAYASFDGFNGFDVEETAKFFEHIFENTEGGDGGEGEGAD